MVVSCALRRENTLQRNVKCVSRVAVVLTADMVRYIFLPHEKSLCKPNILMTPAGNVMGFRVPSACRIAPKFSPRQAIPQFLEISRENRQK